MLRLFWGAFALACGIAQASSPRTDTPGRQRQRPDALRMAARGAGGGLRRELPRVDFRRRLHHRRHPARVRDLRQGSQDSRRGPGARFRRRLGPRHAGAWPCHPQPRHDHDDRQDDGAADGRQRRAARGAVAQRQLRNRCAPSCCLPARAATCRRRRRCWCIRSGSARSASRRWNRVIRPRSSTSSSATSVGSRNTPSRWAGAVELLETALRIPPWEPLYRLSADELSAHAAHYRRRAVRSRRAGASATSHDLAGNRRPATGRRGELTSQTAECTRPAQRALAAVLAEQLAKSVCVLSRSGEGCGVVRLRATGDVRLHAARKRHEGLQRDAIGRPVGRRGHVEPRQLGSDPRASAPPRSRNRLAGAAPALQQETSSRGHAQAWTRNRHHRTSIGRRRATLPSQIGYSAATAARRLASI